MTITIKTTALIHKEDKIMLIKEWSKKKNGYFWNVVKGTFNPGKDKNLSEAITREAKEEINLDINIENILSIFEVKKADGFLLQINFICSPNNESVPSLSKSFEENEEIIEFKWFDFNEFKKIKEEELMDKRVVFIINDFFLGKTKYSLAIIKSIN